MVIFATLVVQGFSLPLLLKVLKIKPQKDPQREERELRLSIAINVLTFIDRELADKISETTMHHIRKKYREITDALSAPGSENHEIIASHSASVQELLTAELRINKFERRLLLDFHQAGSFSHDVIKRMEQKLDLDELLLNRIKQKKH